MESHPFFPKDVQHLFSKRLFDLFFSSFFLVLLLPLYFTIGMILFVSTGLSPIYVQERVGRGGAPFSCYKFRTMSRDADQILETLLSVRPDLKREWDEKHKLLNDPRVTPFGRFLRRRSLDEIPQFWNVVKGDLSLVGPRPVVNEEIEKHFGLKARQILTVRPGLTGLWQVSGRSLTSYEERVNLDLMYVDKRSFWLDLKILVRTIPILLFGSKGAI